MLSSLEIVPTHLTYKDKIISRLCASIKHKILGYCFSLKLDCPLIQSATFPADSSIIPASSLGFIV